MEADIEFFPGPKKPKALTCAGNLAARKGASVWNASHRRGTFTAACSAARLGSGPVFYTTIGN